MAGSSKTLSKIIGLVAGTALAFTAHGLVSSFRKGGNTESSKDKKEE